MKALMKTTKPATPATVDKKWVLIDAVAGPTWPPRDEPADRVPPADALPGPPGR